MPNRLHCKNYKLTLFANHWWTFQAKSQQCRVIQTKLWLRMLAPVIYYLYSCCTNRFFLLTLLSSGIILKPYSPDLLKFWISIPLRISKKMEDAQTMCIFAEMVTYTLMVYHGFLNLFLAQGAVIVVCGSNTSSKPQISSTSLVCWFCNTMKTSRKMEGGWGLVCVSYKTFTGV